MKNEGGLSNPKNPVDKVPARERIVYTSVLAGRYCAFLKKGFAQVTAMDAERKPGISLGMGFRIFQILLTGLNESRFMVMRGRFGFILRNLGRIILL